MGRPGGGNGVRGGGRVYFYFYFYFYLYFYFYFHLDVTSTSTSTTSTTTTVPPTTVPPTTVPCEFGLPTNLSPGFPYTVGTSTPTLSWSYSGCKPALQFDVVIAWGLGVVVGEATVNGNSWTSPPIACGVPHSWLVRARNGGAVGEWASAPVTYDPGGC